MKAVLALVVIYVGAFLIAIQGASQGPVQAAPQESAVASQVGAYAPIDPVKEADIRSLMELVGARDAVQDASLSAAEQFRENLLASVSTSERSQQFVNAFIDSYQRKFNAEDVTRQLVGIYNRHFTEGDVKELLKFYGSPAGQKFAAEMPKIVAETQAAHRTASVRVARDVLQDLRRQYPGMVAQARLVKPRNAQTELAVKQAQPQNQAGVSQP